MTGTQKYDKIPSVPIPGRADAFVAGPALSLGITTFYYYFQGGQSIFLSNKDYNIRKVIRERQEHERYVENLKKKNETLTSEITTLTNENATLTNKNETLTTENASLTQELDRLRNILRDNGIADKENVGSNNNDNHTNSDNSIDK